MAASLPSSFKCLMVKTLTTNFRKAVEIQTLPMLKPGPKEVIVKNIYAGVNATDVNFTAGRYGITKTPFPTGLEAIGQVVSLGNQVNNIKIGDAVGYIGASGYSEYSAISALSLFPLPEIKPEFVSLLVSGLTASIALEKVGEIKKGETVLITAAAGALGQVAVQWCKKAGCHVLGMCSTKEKAETLKALGCDRILNYKEDNVHNFLKKHYPKGLDVIWETIGGELFETLTKHLSIKGRLVIIGAISGYQNETGIPGVNVSNLPVQLLFSSSSLRGFFLTHFLEDFPQHFGKVLKANLSGELKLAIDNGTETPDGIFQGLEGAIRAVEYLQSGKSSGKVIVKIQ